MLKKRIHCVVDREPTSYHQVDGEPYVFAVNLNLECESDASDEHTLAEDEAKSKAAFQYFLQALERVEFHIYSIDAGGTEATYVGPVGAQRNEYGGNADVLLEWLGAKEPERFWTVGSSIAEIDQSKVGATHILRGSHAWSAPVAHRFGLTHIVRIAQDPSTARFVVLPLPEGQAPPDPGLSTIEAQLWELSYRFNDHLEEIVCRTQELQGDEVSVPSFLTDEGYLKVNADADNTRRLLDWFEQNWAGLMSSSTALLRDFSASFPHVFRPEWSPLYEKNGRMVSDLTAPEAAWHVFSSLCSSIDVLAVALWRPTAQAAGGSMAESDILGALVTHLVDAFEEAPSPHVNASAASMKALLQKFLEHSSIFNRSKSIADVVDAIRTVHDIAPESKALETSLRILNALLEMVRKGVFTAEIEESDVRIFAKSISGNKPDEEFAADVFETAFAAAQHLHEEAALEKAITRTMLTAAVGRGKTTVPDGIWSQLCETLNKAETDPEMQPVLTTVVKAWQRFTAQLDEGFNGEEAARRSASSDFVEALLTFYKRSDDGSSASSQLERHVREAKYFGMRFFDPGGGTDCFKGISDSLARLPFTSTRSAGGKSAPQALLDFMAEAYRETVAPMNDLLSPQRRFIADTQPQPLPIQISSEFSGAVLDQFCNDFNGIAVALRRLDDVRGVTDRWSHANLGKLSWKEGEAVGLRQWLPVDQSGRAPMFIDFHGFPFADKLIGQAASDTEAVNEERRLPFYDADVANYSDNTWQRVPQLAYGRRFEAFSFATTNAGSLPYDLQTGGSGLPWMPKAVFEPPNSNVVFKSPYQRRTAIGGVSLIEDANKSGAQRRFGVAIPGVRPLASDYPRLALVAGAGTPGVIDLMREADGTGMLRFHQASDPIEPRDKTVRIDLSDIEWLGGLAAFRVEFFNSVAEPDSHGHFDFDFDIADATSFGDRMQVNIWLDSIYVAENRAGDPAHYECRFRVRVGAVEKELSPIVPADNGWWIRCTVTSVQNVGMSFADPNANSDPEQRGTPLLILAPAMGEWVAGVPRAVDEAAIFAPRVGYLDFERWFANRDRFNATFSDPAKGTLFLDALLAAYVQRDQYEPHDPERYTLAEDMDRLPDPAVAMLYVELVCTDSLTNATTLVAPVSLDLGGGLDAIAAAMPAGEFSIAFLREHVVKPIKERFELSLRLQAQNGPLSLARNGDGVVANIPAGTVAELRVSPIVNDSHFASYNGHPSVLHPGLRQAARRRFANGLLTYPAATVRIETMYDGLVATSRAVELVGSVISCRPVDRARQYAIVAAAAVTSADRNDWRLVDEVAVISQRWRPGGRPIYNYLKPAEHKLLPGAIVSPAMPLRFDPSADKAKSEKLSVFESEAFFERRDIDAETVPHVLLPLVPVSSIATNEPGTVLQTFPWNSPSASYFRHRFQLHSRYAGALAQDRRTVDAWLKVEEGPEAEAWTMRVAMLADHNIIGLTRPQMRALLPLTTQPEVEGSPLNDAPPVIAYLQEPPASAGGLADRIAGEIKVGFGYGFASAAKEAQVGILDSRKQIGPDPKLSYSAMNATEALAIGLVAEGPIGLTFDDPAAAAPSFANSIVSLAPVSVAGQPPASLEEHFLGVSMRRYLDPDWLFETVRTEEPLDARRFLWLDFDATAVVHDARLLSYYGGVDRDLITVEVIGDATYLKVATDEVDTGGSQAGMNWVRFARMPGGKGLSILHCPVAPGRYSASIFCALDVDVQRGRGAQPVPVASFEWSPKSDAVQVKLIIPSGALSRPTVASAPTYLAWTRTSRDCERNWAVNNDGNTLVAKQVSNRSLLVRRRDGTRIRFVEAGKQSDTDQTIWLCSSTMMIRHPVHVHRHLAVIGTKYATGAGRPLEIFSGAAMASTLEIDLSDYTSLAGASKLRIVEFETPASIVCAGPTAVPDAYKSSYFDLRATGGSRERVIRLIFRFVGPLPHLKGFDSITIHLDRVRDAEGSASRCDILITQTSVGVIGAEVTIKGGDVKFSKILADGNHTSQAAAPRFELGGGDPGFLVSMTVTRGSGEFWADISMLHSATPRNPRPERRFDFDWLFSNSESDSALAIQPSQLAIMEEAQARIVSVSPAIAILE